MTGLAITSSKPIIIKQEKRHDLSQPFKNNCFRSTMMQLRAPKWVLKSECTKFSHTQNLKIDSNDGVDS